MPALRYHYSDTIEDFLTRSSSEIIGELKLANVHDVNNKTSMSWLEEIDLLKTSLVEYAGFGSLYFEYNIPRMGRRADVVIIIKGIVFILEFKASSPVLARAWSSLFPKATPKTQLAARHTTTRRMSI